MRRPPPVWTVVIASLWFGSLGAAPTHPEAESTERDDAAIAALVDSLLVDPELPPRRRIATLERLLTEHQAPEVDWAFRAAQGLGEIYLGFGRDKLAIGYFELAARGIRDDANLLNTLGYLYAEQDVKLDEAVELVERALDLSAGSGDLQSLGYFRDSLGWAYFKLGELDSALVHLESANVLAPNTPEIRSHLVDAYAASRRVTDATELLIEDLAATRGTDADIRARLRRLHRTTPSGKPIAAELEVAKRVRSHDAEAIAAIEAEGGVVLRLESTDGHEALGTLFHPEDPSGAAVLLVHAMAEERSGYRALARRLADSGITALAIDVRGHGASVSAALPSVEHFRSDLQASFRGAAADVAAGLRWLAGEGGATKLGVVAASTGGVWLAGATLEPDTPPIVAVALLSPGPAGRLAETLAKPAERRALVLIDPDEPGAASATEELVAALGAERAEVAEFSGAGHGTGMLARAPEVAATLVEWLRDAMD